MENAMTGDAPLTWLTFFTLAAGIVVAAGVFLSFLRSRRNREIAAYALEGDGRTRGAQPSGAGVELGGLLVVALFAMALLVFGYRSHSGTSVAEAPQAPNNQLATDRADPNTPKPYQPQNPAADPRTATTGSTSGSGPDSGGHREGAPK
jgi:hypothetical protein